MNETHITLNKKCFSKIHPCYCTMYNVSKYINNYYLIQVYTHGGNVLIWWFLLFCSLKLAVIVMTLLLFCWLRCVLPCCCTNQLNQYIAIKTKHLMAFASFCFKKWQLPALLLCFDALCSCNTMDDGPLSITNQHWVPF